MALSEQSLVADLLQAAANENTEQALAQARFHFEVVYGGKLPCDSEQLHQYLAYYAGRLSVATLEQRKALLSKWHRRHHYLDPSKIDLETTRELMKGIRKRHNKPQKQAKSLTVETLSLVCEHLQQLADQPASTPRQQSARLQALRNKALLLVGFWFGLRASSLVQLTAEQVTIDMEQQPPAMTLYLASSKTDQQARGEEKTLRMLQHLCPVSAMIDWLSISHIEQGFVFSKVSRWAEVSVTGLLPNSLNKLLRNVLRAAGIEHAEQYSSHSLRRGAANWIADNGGDLHAMMSWIGWKDVKSALRYQDQVNSLPNQLIEAKMGDALKIR